MACEDWDTFWLQMLIHLNAMLKDLEFFFNVTDEIQPNGDTVCMQT